MPRHWPRGPSPARLGSGDAHVPSLETSPPRHVTRPLFKTSPGARQPEVVGTTEPLRWVGATGELRRLWRDPAKAYTASRLSPTGVQPASGRGSESRRSHTPCPLRARHRRTPRPGHESASARDRHAARLDHHAGVDNPNARQRHRLASLALLEFLNSYRSGFHPQAHRPEASTPASQRQAPVASLPTKQRAPLSGGGHVS